MSGEFVHECCSGLKYWVAGTLASGIALWIWTLPDVRAHGGAKARQTDLPPARPGDGEWERVEAPQAAATSESRSEPRPLYADFDNSAYTFLVAEEDHFSLTAEGLILAHTSEPPEGRRRASLPQRSATCVSMRSTSAEKIPLPPSGAHGLAPIAATVPAR